MVIVGLPDELPILAEINDKLPAPFDFDNNTASERVLQVSYRIPPDVDVGYLQIMPSPFDARSPLMVVAGNSEKGVSLAGNALTLRELRRQLAGVFAMTNGEQIASNTQISSLGINIGDASIIQTVVPDAEEIVATPLPLALPTSTVTYEKPSWLIPALLASFSIMLIVIGYILVRALSSRKPPKSDL